MYLSIVSVPDLFGNYSGTLQKPESWVVSSPDPFWKFISYYWWLKSGCRKNIVFCLLKKKTVFFEAWERGNKTYISGPGTIDWNNVDSNLSAMFV